MTSPGHPLRVSLRQLQYVVAVADLGGFGRAAAHCNVAQPSLSAQVLLVEQQLGVQIFERGRRGVRLSAPGILIVEQARRVLGVERELEELASHLRDPFRGTFRIGVLPTVSPYLLPEIMPSLERAFPDLALVWREERTATLVRQVVDGTLDAALVALESDIGTLEHAPLMWDPFVVACSPTHPLAQGKKPLTMAALVDSSVLLLDDGHCFRDQVWGLCTTVGVEEVGFRATSLATLVQMVGSGSRVTLLPEMSLAVENRTHRLVVRRFGKNGPGRTLVLAWRPHSALRAPLERLAETMKQALNGK